MGILDDLKYMKELAVRQVGWTPRDIIPLSPEQMEKLAVAARARGQLLCDFLEEGYGKAVADKLMGES